jgi:hypothetical protein
MEHSHRNNTPTASFYHHCLMPEILEIKTDKPETNAANLASRGSPALQNNYRDAIDGFPVILYCEEAGETTYLGTYMFNIDKSGNEQGFEIPYPGDVAKDVEVPMNIEYVAVDGDPTNLQPRLVSGATKYSYPINTAV